ncbi:C6 transcription factor [Penicillium sp. IBT 18751x]|nr:C6 transcription factor [Penicillium sp. IBT 18751x]
MSPQNQQAYSQDASSLAGPVRQRSKQACLPCRRRKRKCDGNLPCNICKGYGYDCEFGNAVQSTNLKRSVPSDGSTQPRKATRLIDPQESPKQHGESSVLPGILDPSKARYVGRYSSIAFPLYVGLEVQATKIPRLHSFAYHTGIRKEAPCAVTFQAAQKIPWNTMRSLLEVYTATVHPVFGFLDMDQVYMLCEKHWHGQPQDMAFEAMISGVVATASLFSGTLDQGKEMWFILHQKEILEDSVISRFPSLEQIAAWTLRTIYMRCTARPHVTWLSSCTVMHLIEAAGLHRASEYVMQTTSNATPSTEMFNIVNRTAQVATCLHILISFEYGRSIISLNSHILDHLQPKVGEKDLTFQLCSLVAAVPIMPSGDPLSMMEELFSSLDTITDLTVDHDFLVLLRADLALGIYRRLRVMESKFQQGHNDRVIAAGTAALPAARRLASQNQPWWNVIGTAFQFACTLLVMDTPASCELLVDTMDTLEMIVDHLDTHLAKEALSTARQLVRASLDKKKRGVEALERIARDASPDPAFGGTNDHLQRDIAALSPSLAAPLPLDLDSLWAMEFQLPL